MKKFKLKKSVCGLVWTLIWPNKNSISGSVTNSIRISIRHSLRDSIRNSFWKPINSNWYSIRDDLEKKLKKKK
jgi:hypothetical protein